MKGYLLVAAIAAVTTGFFVPLVIRLALRLGAMAKPDSERRLHHESTPQLGGLAMLAGLLVAFGVASRMGQFSEMFASSSQAFGLVVGALVVAMAGTLDDLMELTAPAKIAGLALAGSVMYLLGFHLDQLQVPFGGSLVISTDLIPLVTVFWVILMAVAINFIDGLDGLAAGIVGIASVAFFVYSSRLFHEQIIAGSNIGPLIAVVTAGICAGFLPFNWTPAKVFMGESGAELLGVMLAMSTIVVSGNAAPGVAPGGQKYFFFAPLLIPLLLLGVPIADLALLVVRRTINGSGFATPDRLHIHYRLLDLGHGPRRAVVILWSLTALLSVAVLIPLFVQSRLAMIPVGVGFVALLGFTVLHPDSREQRRQSRASRPSASA